MVTALITPEERRATGFEPIADALRMALLEEYARTGEELRGVVGLQTLEANSGLAPRRAHALLSLLELHVPDIDLAGLRVVDVGCGFGSLAIYLAFLGAEVVALDVASTRIQVGERVARQFRLHVTWIEAPLQEIPLPDRTFDLAVVNNSLCYVVPRHERLLSLVHIRRVLRPGGLMLMRNPNRTALRDPFTGLPGLNRLPPRVADLTAHALGRPRSRVRLLSARGERRELRRVGFEVIDIRAPSSHTFRSLDRWVGSYQHVLARRAGV
jgi:2-polyprenyl-3-methyl-5-hydroxy-6-metoxy-1,4-benzoquinol methylase